MKILTVILLFVLLASCRTQAPLTADTVQLTNSDSIRTEYIERVVVDTVTVQVHIPRESSTEVVGDSTSHLETNIAESDAWINPDGTLGHSLKNKAQPIAVDVLVPHKSTEKNTTAASIKEVPVPVQVYIERNFTPWELFRLKAFWYLVGCLGLLTVLRFRKYF